MKESEIQKAILTKLETHKMAGDVLWFMRINSGKINSGKYWIKLADIGTPDIMAIVDCRDGRIAVLFIEVKRSGVKRLRYEQQAFFTAMDGKPMILCTVMNDPKQLWPAIKRARDL